MMFKVLRTVVLGQCLYLFGYFVGYFSNDEADSMCHEIAGKSAEAHEGHCYQRSEDGSLVPVKAGAK